MPLIVSSTTDSQEDVNAAAGLAAGATETSEEESTTTAGAEEAAGGKPVKEPETEPDEDEGEEEEPGEAEKPDTPQPPKKKGGYLRKIESLERERGYSARRIEELESRLAAQHKAAGSDQPQRNPLEKPVESNFQSWDEYNEALLDWKIAVRDARTHEQATRWHAQEQQRQALEGWQQRMGEFRTKTKDLDDVFASV